MKPQLIVGARCKRVSGPTLQHEGSPKARVNPAPQWLWVWSWVDNQEPWKSGVTQGKGEPRTVYYEHRYG
jgi:hypothetical protein